MARTKIRVESIPLTPEVLAEFRQARPLPGERPLRPRRLNQLLAIIKKGEFLGVDWASGRSKEDQTLYRFDGQHTAHLLQDLLDNPRVDIPFPSGILVTLAHWEFDSVAADAPGIFNTFNAPLSTRSNEDAMATYRAFFSDLEQLELKFLIKVVNGITFYERQLHQAQQLQQAKAGKKAEGKAGEAKQPSLRFDAREAGQLFWTPAYRAFALWADMLKNPTSEGRPLPTVKENLWKVVVNRQGLVARMYADWKESAPTATTFWTLVLNETAPDRDDDTRIFADQLRKMNSDRKKTNQESYWKVAATAIKKFKRVQHAPPAPADEADAATAPATAPEPAAPAPDSPEPTPTSTTPASDVHASA